MKSPIVVLLLIISLVNLTFSQTKTKKINFACNYFGRNISPQEICPQMQGFVSDSHAERVIGQFAKKMGQVTSKFKVMMCPNTDNCFATVIEGQPFIVYDNAFLNRVEETTKTDWAAVSILAHEIGHHANFHTIDGTGSRPEKELEADYFSGFWLHEMGANLSQSQEAMRHFQGEFVTATHPPQSQRLLAIKKGWDEAESTHPQINQINNKPNIQTTQRQAPPRIEQPKPIVQERQVEVIENDIELGRTTVTSSAGKKTGCVSGDCANGDGTYLHATQGSYKGTWEDGRRHGYGIQYYASGKKMYAGEYVRGKRQGTGTFYFQNGEKYEGRFIEDKPTDSGNYILNDDEVNEVVELTYIFSDGRSEIIRIDNEEEEE